MLQPNLPDLAVATHYGQPEYVLLLTETEAGEDELRRFRAGDDDEAVELVQRQFPNTQWILYRAGDPTDIPVCTAPVGIDQLVRHA